MTKRERKALEPLLAAARARLVAAFGSDPASWQRAIEMDPDWLVSVQVFAGDLVALLALVDTQKCEKPPAGAGG